LLSGKACKGGGGGKGAGKAAKAAIGKAVKAVKGFFKGSAETARDSAIDSAVREGVEAAVEGAKVSDAVFLVETGFEMLTAIRVSSRKAVIRHLRLQNIKYSYLNKQVEAPLAGSC